MPWRASAGHSATWRRRRRRCLRPATGQVSRGRQLAAGVPSPGGWLTSSACVHAGLRCTAGRCARRGALSRLQLSAAEDEAKKEAQKWAEMAARMKASTRTGTRTCTHAYPFLLLCFSRARSPSFPSLSLSLSLSLSPSLALSSLPPLALSLALSPPLSSSLFLSLSSPSLLLSFCACMTHIARQPTLSSRLPFRTTPSRAPVLPTCRSQTPTALNRPSVRPRLERRRRQLRPWRDSLALSQVQARPPWEWTT